MRKTMVTMLVCAIATREASADSASVHATECLNSYEDGQLQQRQHDYTAARRSYGICAQTYCPAPMRKDCLLWLSEVTEATSSVVFAAQDGDQEAADVSVTSEGQLLLDNLDGRAIELNPGRYVFELRHGAYPAQRIEVTLNEGEKRRTIRVQFGERPPAATLGKAPLVESVRPVAVATRRPLPAAVPWLLGGAAAGLGTFAYFARTAKSQEKDLVDCKPFCSNARIDPIRQKYLIGDVALGVGLVSLTCASLFYWMRPAVAVSAIKIGHSPSGFVSIDPWTRRLAVTGSF